MSNTKQHGILSKKYYEYDYMKAKQNTDKLSTSIYKENRNRIAVEIETYLPDAITK